jgi:hypothetical protein
MGIDMLRYVTAAAFVMFMIATGARAAVISGTWSFEVDEWPLLNPVVPFPPPPVTGSATFSFDTSRNSEDIPLPANDSHSNIVLTAASYDYNQTFDSLIINFAGQGFTIQPEFVDVSTHFFSSQAYRRFCNRYSSSRP